VTNTGRHRCRRRHGAIDGTRAADGVVQNLVNAGGRIRAATVGNSAGTEALGGVGGSIVVEGQLSAPGRAPGTVGGDIEIATIGNVTVASSARINASGKAGGGVVAVGTTLARAHHAVLAAPPELHQRHIPTTAIHQRLEIRIAIAQAGAARQYGPHEAGLQRRPAGG
jgi:hypothetical protein